MKTQRPGEVPNHGWTRMHTDRGVEKRTQIGRRIGKSLCCSEPEATPPLKTAAKRTAKRDGHAILKLGSFGISHFEICRARLHTLGVALPICSFHSAGGLQFNHEWTRIHTNFEPRR